MWVLIHSGSTPISRARVVLVRETDNDVGIMAGFSRGGSTGNGIRYQISTQIYIAWLRSDGAGTGVQIASDPIAAADARTTVAVSPKQLSDRLDGYKIDVRTTAQYNALVTKDANTIYFAT